LYVVCVITVLVAALLAPWIGFTAGIAGGLLVCVAIWLILEFKTQPESTSEMERAFDALIEAQTVPVMCPCGNTVFNTPVFFKHDTVYECAHCKSKFRVELSYDSVLITEPVNLVSVFEALKDKDKELSYNNDSNENS